MPNTRPFLTFLALFLFSKIVFSQKNPAFDCGFDGLRTPTEQGRIDGFENELSQFFSKKNSPESIAAGPFVVPVVVHIIHENGLENISDARVLAAIDNLNSAFAAANYFAQNGATVNTQIQFCLAKRDPYGNATTGITRDQSSLTSMVMETEDISLKDINRWKPTDYVNIWVVKEITSQSSGPGVAGYAYFPSSHGGAVDGMVCEAAFFGKSPADDGVLIHEMGHYFGLYHTFEGGCKNDNCASDGDRVCDTPPDQAKHTSCPYNSCSTDVAPGSPFTSDVDDLTENFMDYSPFYCYSSFTDGQAARMQAVVEGPRKSLLESKGCLDPCTIPVVADFSAVPNPIFSGQSVVFTNNSTGATGFEWAENGAVFSTNPNETRTFNTAGGYFITLKTTNSDPNCLDTAQVYIVVQCPLAVDFSANFTEIDPGQTVVFTNNSMGGATSFEWSVNGFPLATTPDFSFLFQNSGFFTVKLQASGPFCSKEKTIVVHVKSACGEPEDVIVQFATTTGFLNQQDLVGLPDGSVLFSGEVNKRPFLARFDAGGQVIWQKTLFGNGTAVDIEPMPDGQFAVCGEVGDDFFLAKVDANGNFNFYGLIKNATTNLAAEPELMAAAPDGSLYFVFRKNFNYLIGKLSATGAVLWQRDALTPGSIGGIRVATDGSNDLLVSSGTNTLSDGYGAKINRFTPTGDLKSSNLYNFQGEMIEGATIPVLGAHPDGDFTIVWGVDVNNADQYEKRFIRVRPDGQVRRAGKWNVPGWQTVYLMPRYWPGDGWLIADYKFDGPGGNILANYALRINENDEPVWQKKIGIDGTFGEYLSSSTLQNGRIRAVRNNLGSKSMLLLTLPDKDFDIDCLPDEPTKDVLTILPGKMSVLPETNVLVNFPLLSDVPNLQNTQLIRQSICEQVLPCPEVCDNGIDDDEDGFVDCFDVECDCFEISDTSCSIVPELSNFSIKLAWESEKDFISPHTCPFVANLDPQTDSIPEVFGIGPKPGGNVFQMAIFIQKGDGSDKANPKALAIPGNITDQSPGLFAVADLDSDGIPELIVPTITSKIHVFKNYDPLASPPMALWVTSMQNTNNVSGQISTADFDGDGLPEIFIGNQIFKLDLTNPAAPTLKLAVQGSADAGQSSASISVLSSTAADILSVADCNGDPDCEGLELVAGGSIYSVDLDLSDGDGLEIKEKRNLNLLDPAPTVYVDGFTAVADIDLDGTPEVVFNSKNAANNNNRLVVWNKNGLVRFFPINNVGPPFGSGGPVMIANIFDDKTAGFAIDMPEMVLVGKNELFCFNLNAATLNPAQPFWWKLPVFDASGRTGTSAFDFNGDGLLEIVYRDERNLRVMYGGAAPFPPGVDAERNWGTIESGSDTGDEYPIIADLDADNQAEIIVSGFQKSMLMVGTPKPGRLRVFESAGQPWMPARPVWNQFNYFGLNINDDLTVPKNQQKHWLEMGGIGSGKRPFNTHLAQISSLNPLKINKLPVPDATVTVDSVRCNLDSLDVFLKIGNLGSADFLPKIALSFYKTDPETTAAPLLFPPVFLDKKLEKDSALFVKLTIPATYNEPIFVAINDDGSAPRPFNLTLDTLSTGQPECHLENNFAQFIFQNSTPPLDLGPDILLCESSVVPLSAGPFFEKYRWQNGSTDSTFTAFGPGKYWVDAFDACGFKKTDTLEIKLNPLAALGLPDDLTICAGDSLALAATGLFDEFTWSPADSVSCADCQLATLISKKSITLTVTARTGNCFATDSIHVEIKPAPTVKIEATGGNCAIPASLVATATGSGPFQFLWSNSLADSTITPAQSGTYIVEITDTYGCQATDSVAITAADSLKLTALFQNPKCSGSNDGSADLTVSGGLAPFVFLWKKPDGSTASTEDLVGLNAGNYTVTATDANGCTGSLTDSLSAPAPIFLYIEKTNPTCFGAADGALELTVENGVAPLIFLWKTPDGTASTEDLLAQKPGNFELLVTDASGCSASLLDSLIAPPKIELNFLVQNGDCTTPATITASANGPTPVQFFWETGSSNFILNASQSGTYSVTATDPAGCTAVDSASVLVNLPFDLSLISTQNPTCFDATDGSILIEILGGGGPFSIVWDGPSPAAGLSPNGLSAGNYSATVSDAGGCSNIISAGLSAPEPLDFSFLKKDPTCAGSSDGSLESAVSGGTMPYVFDWSTGATTANISGQKAGIFTLEITDANGCSFSKTDNLTDPPAIVLSLQKTDLNCPGDLGFIDLTASGGTGQLTFFWSNGAISEDISPSLSGIYSVLATDANGCTATAQTEVLTLGSAPILVLKTDTLTCKKSIGQISATANPAAGTSFLWAGPGGFSSNLAAPEISQNGQFSVTATSAAGGCTSVGTVVVGIDTVAPIAQIAADLVEIPCDQTSILLSAAGSSSGADFEINWSATGGGNFVGGFQALEVEVNAGGFYKILIEDLTNGCTAFDIVEVAVFNKPHDVETAVDSVKCFGEMNGAVHVLAVSGGQPPMTYSIDNQPFITDSIFRNLSAGLHFLTIKDANGCLFQKEIEVFEPPIFTLKLSGDSLVSIGEMANLQAEIDPPGFAPAQVYWSNSDVIGPNIPLEISPQVFENTLFSIQIWDENGCTDSASWLVRVDSERRIFVPNSIRPGSASNGVFTIFTDAAVEKIRSLRIFDRWGDLIFENKNFQPNDLSVGWDGQFRGKTAAPQVLVWVAEIEFLDGGTRVLKGDLTVVR